LWGFFYSLPGVELSNVKGIFPWEGFRWEGFDLEVDSLESFTWHDLKIGRPIWDSLTWESINFEGIIDRIYFSVVTITTLGYGDIVPLSGLAKILVALESVTGLIIAGLFLNALSHQHGSEAQAEERRIIISQITGGRSYPTISLRENPTTGALEYWFIVVGETPLYDVKASIKNIEGFEDVKMTDYGVLVVGFRNFIKSIERPRSGVIKLLVEYHARNGKFSEKIRFIEKEEGRWTKQSRTAVQWAEKGAPKEVKKLNWYNVTI